VSEKLVKFVNVFLDGFVVLGNSAPLVKMMIVVIWWYTFTLELVLHSNPSFYQPLKLDFPRSFHTCPVMAACLVSFMVAKLTFSSSKNEYRVKYLSMFFIVNLEKNLRSECLE